jgi:ribosomal protein L16 Arg81 hydroxylase
MQDRHVANRAGGMTKTHRKTPRNYVQGLKGPYLARVLTPLAVSEFLGSYFNRKPLFVRGTPKKFEFLFKESDFAKRIDQLTEIRAVFSGFWQAHIKPAEIKEMLNAGATICVTGIEKAHHKLAEVARSIKSEIGYSGEVDFRAYLSPPGAGFDLHFDARIATTLQIAGKKRWWYSDQPAISFPRDNSPREFKHESGGPAPPRVSGMKSVLLRPGDLLCLPAGVWHMAEADKSSSLALNMAFNYAKGSAFDFIVYALRQRLQDDLEWRKPLVLGPQRKGKSVELKEMRERLVHMREALSLLHDDVPSLLNMWNAWLRRSPA